MGTRNARQSPLARLMPMRSPVNDPGPTATATPRNASGPLPSRSNMAAMAGATSTVCRLSDRQLCSASTPLASYNATLAVRVAVSIARSILTHPALVVGQGVA